MVTRDVRLKRYLGVAGMGQRPTPHEPGEPGCVVPEQAPGMSLEQSVPLPGEGQLRVCGRGCAPLMSSVTSEVSGRTGLKQRSDRGAGCGTKGAGQTTRVQSFACALGSMHIARPATADARAALHT